MPDADLTPRASSVVCTHCGCACDDLGATVADGGIAVIDNACSLSRPLLLGKRDTAGPAAWIDGRAAELDAALDAAAGILSASRRPLIFGAVACTTEAQSAAVRLARDLCGVFDSPALPHEPLFPGIGSVTCSLGEAKNRAEVIVVWNCDPEATHPRLLSRYLVDPPGRWRPRGRADRRLIVVGRDDVGRALAADEFVPLTSAEPFAELWRLRERARSGERDPLLDRLRAAKFSVLVFDPSAGARAIEAAHALAADLQSSTRCYVLVLRGPGNPLGVVRAVTWLTGRCGPVSFRADGSADSGGAFCATGLLARQEVDAVLQLGGDLGNRQIPQIDLSPQAGETGRTASIAIRTSEFPIAQSGTVFRLDGVALPIRPVIPSSAPSEFAVLEELRVRLRTPPRRAVSGR